MAVLTMRLWGQPVAAGGNGFLLVQAVFVPWAARAFATGFAPSVP